MCNYNENEQAKKYRIARGEFQRAITKFNNTIKELEVELLKYQIKYPNSNYTFDASMLQQDINGMYIKLTEIDTIILCYKQFNEKDNFCREYKISKEKKVTDAIKFYDECINIKRYLSRRSIFSNISDISQPVNLAFEELKRTFLAFADI